MNSRQDFSPITVGKVSPPQIMGHAALLEPARVQPCYEGMDDTSAYAQTLGRVGSHRAMQAEPLEALAGNEALDELTFQQLLDLQDEASEDESFDTFNDVSRELRDRRSDAKVALVKLFVAACDSHGSIPMTSARTLVPMFICDYLREALGTNAGTSLAIDMVMHPNGRERSVAALAAEYANEQAEDVLRAGFEVQA